MKKTFRKLDNTVIKALTNACEIAKDWDCGFEWLTHTADYNKFPESLMVTCVFASEEDIARVREQNIELKLHQLIAFNLSAEQIVLKNVSKHVQFVADEP